MTLRPLSRFLWIFLVCLTLIACSDTITPPAVPGDSSPEDGPLPDDAPAPGEAPEPGGAPEPGDDPAPDDTPEPGEPGEPAEEPDPDYPDEDYPDNPEDAPEDPGEDDYDPANPGEPGDPNETPAPAEPAPDDPVTTPRNLTPTLLKTFDFLDTRELDDGKGLVKRYDGLTYRPLNEGAWDRLDILEMLSNRTPEQDPDDWDRKDWLSLTFNRDATVALLWSGDEIPGWLSSWQEVDTQDDTRRFEKRFKQTDTAKLGRGEGKGFYNLLIGEADGGDPIIPALPNGISERPVPNERCPEWVHDQYVAEHPDDGRIYRTWHPAIDPIYWCYFEHEHGSDPALANYTPYFGYTAAKNSEDERHEGFKGFVFKQGDTNWYLNVHATTGLDTRACVRLHTVVLAATDANGELLAELSFKGDFGETRANTGDRAVITNSNCPQGELAEAGTEAVKQLRVLNQNGYKNNAYEEWNVLGQAFLGLAGPKAFNHINVDIRNPVTGCDGLRCESFELTDPENNRGDVRTLHFRGDLNLSYSEERDKSDGKEDGYFYTDAKGTKFLDANDENAVRQYVSRTLTIQDSEKLGTRDAWRGMYSDDIQRFLPGFNLEDSLGLMN